MDEVEKVDTDLPSEKGVSWTEKGGVSKDCRGNCVGKDLLGSGPRGWP